MALRFAENGHTVLYLASKPLDKLPSPIKHSTDTDALKNIIFMYYNSNASLLLKLLEIHNWIKTPKLVIIESMEKFFNFQTQTYVQLILAHTIIMAALHNCVTTFSESFQNKIAFSLISINTEKFKCYKKMMPIFVDLYYYKNNWMTMNEHIMENIRNLFQLT